MKTRIIFLNFILIFFFSKSFCTGKSQQIDSAGYEKKIELLIEDFKSVENDVKNLKNHSPQYVNALITYLTYSIGFVAVLFAIASTVMGFLTFNNYKRLEKKILEKIKIADNTIEALNGYKISLERLEKSQTRNLEYFDKSMIQFSLIFKILSSKNKIDQVSERIAIGKIYSSKSEIRFSGLSELFVYGSEESLPHLEFIINDPEEDNTNISIATLVWSEIRKRIEN